MNNKFIRVILGEIILLGILLGGITVVKFIPSSITKENDYRSPTLFKKVFEKDLVTTFKAGENNLKRIDVLFKNPNLESRDEIEIVLFKDKRVVFKNIYNGYNFGDTSHARIDFPKIIDSKDKYFRLEVRNTKLVDGKLSVGIKNDEINFIQYYGESKSISEALKASIKELNNIIKQQTIVLILPMLLWAIFLW